ncbi:MAG TPA: vWA domain-containing protein [Kofleriaceae bacterium]|nr:vWA domain-containing protein [Kofleriaceae bacterium]
MRGTWAVLFLIACGPTGQKHPGNGGDDDDTGSGSIDAGETYFDSAGNDIDASCGAQMQQIGVVNLGDPPDLLIVLDRSGSMTEPPPAFPPVFDSKWNIMKNALNSIATMKDQNIKFGLLEFPSDQNCAADANPEVAIALGAHTPMATYFAGRSPGGNTPAHVALTSALSYYQTIPTNPAGRYVLFATDGLPNCLGGDPDVASDQATVQAVQALYNAGIPTYVLGFGTFGLPTGVLNDAAQAGGKAKTGVTKFYEANNANDLAMALQAIAGGIIVPSCTFQLQSVPPDPTNVTVTINGTAVPRSPSHMNGWDYYPNMMTITFFGSYCSQIMMGSTTNVSFVYGCPGPIIQ